MYWLPPNRRRPPRRIACLGELTLTIRDCPAGRWPRRRTLLYRAELIYDDGSTRQLTGDLAGLLDGETLERLHALLDALRTRAAERLIPGAKVGGARAGGARTGGAGPFRVPPSRPAGGR